jgi:hypothetical protein
MTTSPPAGCSFLKGPHTGIQPNAATSRRSPPPPTEFHLQPRELRLHLAAAPPASSRHPPRLQSSRPRRCMLRCPPPRRLCLRLRLRLGSPVSTMASTLSFLRPSAPAPLAASRGAARGVPAAVRVPCRSRVSAAGVSLGSEEAVGSDALFADYKPTTAFLFPGQVTSTRGLLLLARSTDSTCVHAYRNLGSRLLEW